MLWRCFVVRSDCTLANLHFVLQMGVFAYSREKVQSRIWSRLETEPLPVLRVFIDHLQVGKVQAEGGGTEALMAEKLLNGGQRDAFLQGHRGKGVSKHVRRHVLGNAGALGDPLDDLLYLVQTNEPALIQGEVRNRLGQG